MILCDRNSINIYKLNLTTYQHRNIAKKLHYVREAHNLSIGEIKKKKSSIANISKY